MQTAHCYNKNVPVINSEPNKCGSSPSLFKPSSLDAEVFSTLSGALATNTVFVSLSPHTKSRNQHFLTRYGDYVCAQSQSVPH